MALFSQKRIDVGQGPKYTSGTSYFQKQPPELFCKKRRS